MAHGHASTVEVFIRTDEDALIGRLVDGVGATGISTHEQTQINAWRDEIRLLKEELSNPAFQDWFIILEYEIPRRSRRPDVILLSPTTIFVLEFKIGSDSWDSASRWQVNSYARDLRDFHAESKDLQIVPVLCSTRAPGHWSRDRIALQETPGVLGLVRTNGTDLDEILIALNCTTPSDSPLIDPLAWLNSPYRPTPTIIDAAVQLYEGNGIREISHHYAYNLDQTTEMVVNEIDEARRFGRKVIIFVTGVPGAGKTLTGLDVVHDPSLRRSDSFAGIFLSGNGPLVKVVREALVRSRRSEGRSKGERERQVSTFIQNVHYFLRYHRDNPQEVPHENVIVFDEAQRAWNSVQMERKWGVPVSEPTMLLEIMERFSDWAAIIALVGGGQEIYLGEAGLEEWGTSLADRPVEWRVIASSEVLEGGNSVSGHRLFVNDVPKNVSFQENALAHLDMVVRSHRAQRWAEWVNHLLELNLEVAMRSLPDTGEFPCFVTRNLETARSWLRMHNYLNPEQRTGLIASSSDLRLRAYGIEMSTGFHRGFAFERWFLDPMDDIRSSYLLEVAASEFECQGLELDWVGVCWGGDLTPDEDFSTWKYGKFRGSAWQNVKQEAEQAYSLNRYRVLLTRARNGLVIWVPFGDYQDPTRDPDKFDRVYEVLLKAGVPPLEEHFDEDDLQYYLNARN